jgi:hypothetical protein
LCGLSISRTKDGKKSESEGLYDVTRQETVAHISGISSYTGVFMTYRMKELAISDSF